MPEATVVLAGNPNSGKTTLFNRLTGANHRTANYPGITVSHTLGAHRTAQGRDLTIVDLPGTYSLNAHSPDEQVAQRFLLGDGDTERNVDLLGVVVDATNLERSLYLASQLCELGRPAVLILNMVDAADRRGLAIDHAKLEAAFGVPVVPIVALDPKCVPPLDAAFERALAAGPAAPRGQRQVRFSDDLEAAILALVETIAPTLPGATPGELDFLARKLLGSTKTPLVERLRARPEVATRLDDIRRAHPDLDFDEHEVQRRFDWLRAILADGLRRPHVASDLTDRLDRLALGTFTGPLVMFGVFAVLFSAIFYLAAFPADWIDAGKSALIDIVGGWLGAGELSSLVTDGIIEGVGAVVVFVPQIALLFLIVAFLEDSGYLARAAFVLDRPLSRVGLSGRSFMPLLSSFACAIPGVMATRTIPSRRERLIAILISPLMVCSARLPVYALLIAAFIVPRFGAWSGGVTLVALYLVHILVAAATAFVFSRTILRGAPRPLVLELPEYRRPSWRNILITAGSRCWDFIRNAGTIILAISIVLWFLASHPAPDIPGVESAATETSEADAELALEQSYAGRIGRAMEPVIAPLGYDWKLGVSLLTSFAAREVFVGTMSTLYGLSEDDAELDRSLEHRIVNDTYADGTLRYGLLTALSLLLFYAFACQCMSTVAVVARETRSWRWALFMFAYMSVLAYVSALAMYQGGKLLGLG